jgi:hypothetical protein
MSQVVEKKLECNAPVYHLFKHFKKAYDPIRREALYNILMEFGILMKLIRLIKMGLNEIKGTVCTGKQLSDTFSIQNGLKQRDALLQLCVNVALQYAIGSSRKASFD